MKTNFRKLLTSAVFLLVITIFISCQKTPEKEQNAKNETKLDIIEKDIFYFQEGYKNGIFTIKEVVQAYLDRIEEIDKNGPKLNSIIIVNPDAIKIAEELDAELKAGKSRGPLHGIVVILKDNIDTHDKMPTTAGSFALKNSFPLKDSYLTKLLREAGAIIIGKSNLSEWANFRGEMSSSGWSGVGGQTLNPYILSCNPCGSSSGSGVAVSANLTMIAIGTETNGSIVCPSHVNGIVGIKPTVGLISRSGIIPISFSQDTPGPMARNVRDAAICLGELCGIDKEDSKTLESKGKTHKDYTKFLKPNGLNGKRIGIDKSSLGINYKTDALFFKAVEYMKSKGAIIVDIDEIINSEVENNSFNVMLYEYKDGLNKYFKSLGSNSLIKNIDDLIAFNNADSVELKYFNQKYLYMANEKGDLESKEYKKSLEKMTKGSQKKGIDKVMDDYKLDAIIAATGNPAWKTDHTNGDNYQFGSSSVAAISGYPSITVPMGFIDNLPVGISFFGRAWSEPLLLEIAYSYEQGTKYRKEPKFLID
jgi:amidase